MEEIFELLGNIVKCFGVQTQAYSVPLPCLENYDGGLRSRLFKIHDTRYLEEFMLSMERNIIYIAEDSYCCHFCFLKFNKYYIIGPWTEIMPAADDIDEIVRKNSIPIQFRFELEHYFNNLPLISSHMCWEAMLVAFMEHICGTGTIKVSYRKLESGGESESNYSPEQDSVLSAHFIEELYKNEDILLNAVRNGNAREAMRCVAYFSYYQVPERVTGKFRNFKNYMLILNTLFRKAVQSSYVHPLYIHSLSSDFARRIEATTKHSELNYILDSMVRRYCALVQDHSLGKFSLVIRNVLSTVEFNLREPLSLSTLAEQYHIDPSNLAHQFKRELGVTLTDYINFRRMELAKSLLSGSGLYIQEIAEQCGFLDTNYFTRLFKKSFGISPREYRRKNI